MYILFLEIFLCVTICVYFKLSINLYWCFQLKHIDHSSHLILVDYNFPFRLWETWLLPPTNHLNNCSVPAYMYSISYMLSWNLVGNNIVNWITVLYVQYFSLAYPLQWSYFMFKIVLDCFVTLDSTSRYSPNLVNDFVKISYIKVHSLCSKFLWILTKAICLASTITVTYSDVLLPFQYYVLYLFTPPTFPSNSCQTMIILLSL